MVTGHDHLGISGDCTFQNSVVRVVREHLQPSPRSDTLSDLVDEHRYPGELFAVAAELPCEHAEKLVKDLLGEDELISTVDEPTKRFLSGTARKYESRNEDVRIEDYLHDVR